MDDKPSLANIDLSSDVLIDEIDDFVYENPINRASPISTVEKNIQRMENMRLTYRTKFRDDANKLYKAVMLKIKTYIMEAKQDISEHQLEKLSKIKDPTKFIEALVKIINTMKELISLACEHDIEPHLYYGDGINHIYKA